MSGGPAASTSLCFRPQTSTENFSRLCQLIMKICSDLLRDILSRYIKPAELRSELNKNKSKLEKIMNHQQKQLIYSVTCKTSLAAKDLDISLLYIILRNICNIPSHKNGWGKQPMKADNSISACIERIRFQRNLISAHSTNGEVDEAKFHNYWDELSGTVLEIEKQLIGGESYERAVKSLLTCDLNPGRTEIYQAEFKKLHERMEQWERTQGRKLGKKRKRHGSSNRNKMEGIEKRLKCLEDNVQKIYTENDNNVGCHKDEFNDDVDDYENDEDVDDDEDDYYMDDTYDFYDEDDDDDNDDDNDGEDDEYAGESGDGESDDEDNGYDYKNDNDDYDYYEDDDYDDGEDNDNSNEDTSDESDSESNIIEDDLCYYNDEDSCDSSNDSDDN